MQFKKLILILTIATFIIFACLWGSSYAYYTYTGGPNIDATTGTLDENAITVIFNQNEYISLRTGVPITADQIDEYAEKSTFTIIPNRRNLDGSDAVVTISLTDLSVDAALRVSDFKFDFKCNDGENDIGTASYTGSNLTDSIVNSRQFVLATLSTSDSVNRLSVDKEYNCTFRMWLQDSGSSQNSLMNKKISGLIKVDAMYKK